jgi:hypothetical protein
MDVFADTIDEDLMDDMAFERYLGCIEAGLISEPEYVYTSNGDVFAIDDLTGSMVGEA